MFGVTFPGIEPRWTDCIPEHLQEAVVSRYPDVRLAWNERIHRIAVLNRCPGKVSFNDGWLSGWSIATHLPRNATVDVTLEHLWNTDRWRDARDKYDAYEKVDRLLVESAEKREAESDAESDGLVDEFMSDQKRTVLGLAS